MSVWRCYTFSPARAAVVTGFGCAAKVFSITSDRRIVWSSCGCAITRESTTLLNGFESWLSTLASRKRCGDVSFTKSRAKPAVVPAVVQNAARGFSGWSAVVQQVVQPLPASQSDKPQAAVCRFDKCRDFSFVTRCLL